jgi:Glycosyltransferase family 92
MRRSDFRYYLTLIVLLGPVGYLVCNDQLSLLNQMAYNLEIPIHNVSEEAYSSSFLSHLKNQRPTHISKENYETNATRTLPEAPLMNATSETSHSHRGKSIHKSKRDSKNQKLSISNRTVKTIPKHSSRVRFRPFLKNDSHHNTTVEGKLLPGPFHHDDLFLLGVRLTTSYEKKDSQVHIDVFGFPGNFVGSTENRYCDVHSLPRQWNLTDYETFENGSRELFCQLECINGNNGSFSGCGEPIKMQFIPLLSGDFNQNQISLIWRCNVTKYLKKSSLIEHSALHDRLLSVRVKLYMKDNTKESKPFLLNDISQIDIPLRTAVAGYGGAQIRPKNFGYFSPRQQKSPIRVGMCLSLFESRAAVYIPEFLHHHKNVGIEQFMIGFDANLNSTALSIVQGIVKPYLDEGLVVLQAFGLNDYFNCETDVMKLQFYHQCLYHYKGITKYVVTWDIDEYWIPPNRLEISGHNSFKVYHEAISQGDTDANKLDLNKDDPRVTPRYINQSDVSSFPSFVTNDKLWKKSNYSKAISFYDTINAIERYRERHGCQDKWCYHLFPSYLVAMRSKENRKNLVFSDFLFREAKTNMIWRKGLVQTRFAMMNGFHLAGSCKFPDNPFYYEYGADRSCFPISWTDGEFGSLHHFHSLIEYRDDDTMLTNEKDGAKKDEYVLRFGKTVIEQLKKYKRMPPLPKNEKSRLNFEKRLNH